MTTVAMVNLPIHCNIKSDNIYSCSQGSQFAIFRGGTFTPFLMFQGVFSPPLHQLRGYHSVVRAASPSQAMTKDSKYYSECSIWILTVQCNAQGLSQYCNFRNQKITMLEKIGYITELTAWHCFQGHMSGTCVWRGGNHSHFFRLTQRTKF